MLLRPFQWIFWFLTWVGFSLRYWVTVRGQKEVFQHPGPYLILPNHPSYSDPPNLISKLWPMFKMRPVLLETIFSNPLLKIVAKLQRAIAIPDLAKASAEARKKAEDVVKNVAEILKSGDNVIIWPSGHLTRDGMERVGGARAASDLLAAVPNVTVVLVRTRGLWGSMYSWAPEHPIQGLGKLTLRSIWVILSNLIFFAPRRRLTITLEAFPPDKRPAPNREAINAWLDAWYNADTNNKPEEPTFVPYHRIFGKRTFEFPPPLVKDLNADDVKPATKHAIAEMIEEKRKRPLTDEENRPNTKFTDLGIDSLDSMELTLQVEQRYGFSSQTLATTLGELWLLAEGQLGESKAKPVPPVWFKPPSDTNRIVVLGETIAEAFVNRCAANPKDIAAADDIAGVLTYERLYVGGRAMMKRLEKYEEPNIGLLMPASVAGDLALLAIHLTGKLPVVLNWTTGPNNLAHAVKLMGLKHVITSKRFIDRTQLVVPGTEFIYLEEVRKSIGKLEMLMTLIGFRYFRGRAVRNALAKANRDPNAPAVVLFTSGSEKAPKAVPLTHANIIANMRGCIEVLHLTRSCSILGFLPLFHSFGHSVTGLFPLLGGVKVVHHPDPTDASNIVRKIAGYKPTLMAATPTFLGHILDRAKTGDLDSLTIAVSGAEKCPDITFQKAKRLAPNAKVIEGYGITECSPVVTANPPEAPHHGSVGKPLPGTELAVCELDTQKRVPQGSMGMLHVSGPSVFPGYIGFDGPSPFVEFEGKKWYMTGDLAAIDENGYVIFHGRLKRFIKAGGEMISLPALEEPFTQLHPPTEDGPRVAVEGIEIPNGRRIVLFTTVDIDVRSANEILAKEGFRGVMRLDEVKKVDNIPVLGTGKTDYKALRAMIKV